MKRGQEGVHSIVLMTFCVCARRFGFKCATCADSSPCPDLIASSTGVVAAPHMEETHAQAVSQCAVVMPCTSCATGAPCPMLVAFGQLRLIAFQHASAEDPDEQQEQDAVVLQHAHVWRSLCRRALWKSAESPAASAQKSDAQTATASAEQQPSEDAGLEEQLKQPQIAPERLVMHRHKESCWLGAEGKVYDVTLFLSRHPAGPEVILKYAGSDCSEDLALHSAGAQELWQKYCIGFLSPNGKFVPRSQYNRRSGGAIACAQEAVPCDKCASDEPCPLLFGGGGVRRSIDGGGRRSIDGGGGGKSLEVREAPGGGAHLGHLVGFDEGGLAMR